MLAALCATALLQHPASPLRTALPDPLLRRAAIGLALGATAIALVYSPFGKRSGAHFNPVMTLTFFRLGKEEMRAILESEGIEVVVAETRHVQGHSGNDVRVALRTPAGERQLEGSDILVAAGRTPNTAGIGLDVAGVALDDRGFIEVDDRLATSAPGVWGIGECCAGHPQFTHVSFDDFRVLRANLAGGDRTTRDRLVPYCMFTDPELARVGLSENEARARGIAARVATLPTSAVLRAKTIDEERGFMKLHEGAGGRHGPDPRLHDDRPGGRRGDGRRPDRHAVGSVLFAAARCRARASDHGGRTRRSLLFSNVPPRAA